MGLILYFYNGYGTFGNTSGGVNVRRGQTVHIGSRTEQNHLENTKKYLSVHCLYKDVLYIYTESKLFETSFVFGWKLFFLLSPKSLFY